MTTLTQEYAQLLAATKKYLHQEFAADARITVPPSLYTFFQERDQQRFQQPPPPPAQAPPVTPPPQELQRITPVRRPTPIKRKTPPKRRPPTKAEPQTVGAPKERQSLEAVRGRKQERVPLDDIELIIKKVAPTIRVIDPPSPQALSPSAKATVLSEKTLSPVVLLCIAPTLQERNFLENIVRAVTSTYTPCRLFLISPDSPPPWPLFSDSPCKLLLLTKEMKDKLPPPSSFSQPTIHLKPVSTYLTAPEEKRALWAEIQQQMSGGDE